MAAHNNWVRNAIQGGFRVDHVGPNARPDRLKYIGAHLRSRLADAGVQVLGDLIPILDGEASRQGVTDWLSAALHNARPFECVGRPPGPLSPNLYEVRLVNKFAFNAIVTWLRRWWRSPGRFARRGRRRVDKLPALLTDRGSHGPNTAFPDRCRPAPPGAGPRAGPAPRPPRRPRQRSTSSSASPEPARARGLSSRSRSVPPPWAPSASPSPAREGEEDVASVLSASDASDREEVKEPAPPDERAPSSDAASTEGSQSPAAAAAVAPARRPLPPEVVRAIVRGPEYPPFPSAAVAALLARERAGERRPSRDKSRERGAAAAERERRRRELVAELVRGPAYPPPPPRIAELEEQERREDRRRAESAERRDRAQFVEQRRAELLRGPAYPPPPWRTGGSPNWSAARLTRPDLRCRGAPPLPLALFCPLCPAAVAGPLRPPPPLCAAAEHLVLAREPVALKRPTFYICMVRAARCGKVSRGSGSRPAASRKLDSSRWGWGRRP
jgi:hypothetical protein